MIQPFEGLRYVQAKAGDLAHLVTQPYDKITADLKSAYEAASPWNAVRLIRGERSPDDAEWYGESAARLGAWLEAGVLGYDPQPGYYVLRQRFRDAEGRQRERTGFIGLLDLGQRDRVRHHERTHAGPRADRRRLLEATGVHFGLIFLLRHRGPPLARDVLSGSEHLGEVTDGEGTEHRLGLLVDAAAVTALRAAFADSWFVIADGHHRFTVACDHADAHRDDAAAQRVLVAVVDLDDPGLVVLPTHRVLWRLPNDRVRGLSPLIQRIGGRPFPWLGDPEPFFAAVRSAGAGTAGVLFRNGAFLLPLGPPGSPDDATALDTARLQDGLLEPLLSGLDVERHLAYQRHAGDACEEIRAGADCAFILNPVDSRTVAAVAERGGVMPPKSTDFFPKMLTGLVFYDTRRGRR